LTTILIVEDDNSVRELLRIILAPAYQVEEAVEAAQAIQLAQSIRPDLVLLDLNLQDRWDGLEVCRTLRSDRDPILAWVPILMLTGYTSGADITAVLAAGANAYLTQPYSPDALSTLIDALLVRRAG
jgi:DNA-binding response OmpR family regulator